MLDAGTEFAEIAKIINAERRPYDTIVNEDHMKTIAWAHPLEVKAAEEMRPGEVSDVVVDGRQFVILKCISKEQNRVRPFETVKALVRKRYIDDKFAKIVDSLAKEAKVVIDNDVYKKLMP